MFDFQEIIDSFTAWFGGAFSIIFDFFAFLLGGLFKTFFDFFAYFAEFGIVAILDIAMMIFTLIGETFTTVGINPADYISALPPEVLNIAGLVGMAEAMTIIIMAILLRMIIKVLPFID